MLIIDRYIFKVWLSNFVLVLGFLLGLFFCHQVYDNLIDLLRLERSLIQLFHFFLISLVVLMPMLIPLSFFISILFTILGFQKSAQLTVLKSCGLSLFRVSRSLWFVSVILSIIVLLSSLFLIPNLVEQKNNLLVGIHQSDISVPLGTGKTQLLNYENFYENRIWYIEDFSPNKYSGAYTILHQMDSIGNELNRIIAKNSFYDKDLKTWVFVEGTELFFDPVSGDPLRSVKFKHKQFLELKEDPEDFLLFNRKLSSLSFYQLKELIDMIPKNIELRRMYLIEYYGFFVAPFLSIIFVGISIPFLSKGIYGNSLISLFYATAGMVLFFITQGVFQVLGQQALISPLFAVLLPYVIFAMLSLKLYWQE